MAYLKPERYFSRISRIDIQRDLLDKGYRFVLLDIDNTILSRATHDVPRDVMLWLAQARQAGVELCLVSNNWHAHVYDLACSLRVPIVAKSCKPFPAAFLLALRKLGARRRETVVVGDQLSTDVLGAHNAGLAAYLVAPLVEQDLKHTLYVRQIERAILGDARPEGATATAPLSAASDAPANTSATAPAAASPANPASLTASPAAVSAAPASPRGEIDHS